MPLRHAFAFVIDRDCIRPVISHPRQRHVGVDPSNFNKLVGIEDPEPSVVKLEDTVAA
jgi:hypothetical protein